MKTAWRGQAITVSAYTNLQNGAGMTAPRFFSLIFKPY